MIRGYLFALDPTDAQTEAFRSHCGAQRYAFNFGLALVRANLDQRAGQPRHRPGQLGGIDIRYPGRPEGRVPPIQVPPQPHELPVHHRRIRARPRPPPHPAPPDRPGPHPRVHPQARPPHRDRHRPATLSQQRGRWHVSLSVELPDPAPTPRIGAPVVGVDLGIKSLAVLSTGQTVPNPRHLDRSLAALRRAQRTVSRRRGPDRRTRTGPSHRWRKAKARVTALHTHVANSRRDGLHQLTTRLVRGHDTIVIEDLHVAGMIRNRCLARRLAGLGMAELRRQIEYKAADAGVRVIVADRWYPSSKTCSACGAVKAKLTLAEREFVCDTCGTRIDRDVNAAMNLAALADQAVSGELRPDVKRPAGNPRQTATGGNGYRHGKTQNMSQRRPREEATPTS